VFEPLDECIKIAILHFQSDHQTKRSNCPPQLTYQQKSRKYLQDGLKPVDNVEMNQTVIRIYSRSMRRLSVSTKLNNKRQRMKQLKRLLAMPKQFTLPRFPCPIVSAIARKCSASLSVLLLGHLVHLIARMSPAIHTVLTIPEYVCV
jgi:hypothetical protein